MTLPIYHLIQLEADYFEKLQSILSPNLNTHQPIVFDAKKLDIDQQRELIGIVENYFSSNSLSHRFPYPIYILSDLEKSISRIILVKEKSSLPKFFNQKEDRLTKWSFSFFETKIIEESLLIACE